MSRLQELLLEAKRGLKPWERIPPTKMQGIATQCGQAEIADIQHSKSLHLQTPKSELLMMSIKSSPTMRTNQQSIEITGAPSKVWGNLSGLGN